MIMLVIMDSFPFPFHRRFSCSCPFPIPFPLFLSYFVGHPLVPLKGVLRSRKEKEERLFTIRIFNISKQI